MERDRFDHLTRTFATRSSRRLNAFSYGTPVSTHRF